MLKSRLTADVWVLQVLPVLLGLQKHLQVYPFGLRLVVDESSRDASGEARLVAAKAHLQQNLLRVVVPQVQDVHHTDHREKEP